MPTNRYFEQSVKSEQLLVEDLIIESIQIKGQDVYYLPRSIVTKDDVFDDALSSRFGTAYMIEVYPENVEGFDGENDLFTKFGVEIRDQATFIMSKRRWRQLVGDVNNDISEDRPREGDLLYLNLSKSFFQIMHVEHEQPFYQISDIPSYKLRCELFEFSAEDFDTGITEIDRVEASGYELVLSLADSDGSFVIGETVTQTLGSGVVVNGEVTVFDDSTDVVKLTHIGSDDSDYHTFSVGGVITGATSGASRTITAVDDEFNQPVAKNDIYTTETTDFVDFSESNPFGEIERD